MIKVLIKNDGDTPLKVTTDSGSTEVEPQGFVHVESEAVSLDEVNQPDGQAPLFTTT